MPIVPHLSELVFSLVWAGLVMLLVAVLGRVLLRRARRERAVDRNPTTPRDEQDEEGTRGR